MDNIKYSPEVITSKVLPSYYVNYMGDVGRLILNKTYEALLRVQDAYLASALTDEAAKSVLSLTPLTFQPLHYVQNKGWTSNKIPHAHFSVTPLLSSVSGGVRTATIADVHIHSESLYIRGIRLSPSLYTKKFDVWANSSGEIKRGTRFYLKENAIIEYLGSLPDGFVEGTSYWENTSDPTYDDATVHTVQTLVIDVFSFEKIETFVSDGETRYFELSDIVDTETIKVYIDSIPVDDYVSYTADTTVVTAYLDDDIRQVQNSSLYITYETTSLEVKTAVFPVTSGIIILTGVPVDADILGTHLSVNYLLNGEGVIENDSIILPSTIQFGELSIHDSSGKRTVLIKKPTNSIKIKEVPHRLSYYGAPLLRQAFTADVVDDVQGFRLTAPITRGAVMRVAYSIKDNHDHKRIDTIVAGGSTAIIEPLVKNEAYRPVLVWVNGTRVPSNTITVTTGVGFTIPASGSDRHVVAIIPVDGDAKHTHITTQVKSSELVQYQTSLPIAKEGGTWLNTFCAGIVYDEVPTTPSGLYLKYTDPVPSTNILIDGIYEIPKLKRQIFPRVDEEDASFVSYLKSAEYFSDKINITEDNIIPFDLVESDGEMWLYADSAPENGWLHNTYWDEQVLQKRWGRLLDVIQESNIPYANLLKALIVGSRGQQTPESLQNLLSIVMGSDYTETYSEVLSISPGSVEIKEVGGSTTSLIRKPGTSAAITKGLIAPLTAVDSLATIIDGPALSEHFMAPFFLKDLSETFRPYDRLDTKIRTVFVSVPESPTNDLVEINDYRANFYRLGVVQGDLVKFVVDNINTLGTGSANSVIVYARVVTVVSENTIRTSAWTIPSGVTVDPSWVPVLYAVYGRLEDIIDSDRYLDQLTQLPNETLASLAYNLVLAELAWVPASMQEKINASILMDRTLPAGTRSLVTSEAYKGMVSPLTDTLLTEFTEGDIDLETFITPQIMGYTLFYEDTAEDPSYIVVAPYGEGHELLRAHEEYDQVRDITRIQYVTDTYTLTSSDFLVVPGDNTITLHKSDGLGGFDDYLVQPAVSAPPIR